MSWSLPREILRPQRRSRSIDGSVSRPDFCTASLRRVSSMTGSLGALRAVAVAAGGRFDSIRDERVAAIARGNEARDPAYGGDAHAGELVNLAIGHSASHVLDDGPAIGHGLQLGRRAEVAEERAAFLRRAQRRHGGEQAALGLNFLARTHVSVEFHNVPMY